MRLLSKADETSTDEMSDEEEQSERKRSLDAFDSNIMSMVISQMFVEGKVVTIFTIYFK